MVFWSTLGVVMAAVLFGTWRYDRRHDVRRVDLRVAADADQAASQALIRGTINGGHQGPTGGGQM